MTDSPHIHVMLDSGAFSAWNSGKVIDLPGYCAYIQRNSEWLGSYVALDVINPQDPDAAAEQSFANLLYMRAQGLNPVPVYHAGEDVKWLHKMLDLGCDYIGLSASSLVKRGNVDDWYASAWGHLVNKEGLPIVKTHAFGEGRTDSLLRFPWHTSDSMTWIHFARVYGWIRSNSRSQPFNMLDFKTMDYAEKEEVAALLDNCGVSFEFFTLDPRSPEATILRSYLMLLFYKQEVVEIQAKRAKTYKPSGFFAPTLSTKPCYPEPTYAFHLGATTEPSAYPIFAKTDTRSCMISYFYLQNVSNKGPFPQLRDFVYNPRAVAQSNPVWNKYWQILEKYTDDRFRA